MKNKKIIIIVSVVVVLLLCLFVPSLISYFSYDNLPKEVIVYEYGFNNDQDVKEIIITDEKEIKSLSRYVKRLDSANNVDIWLALLEDVKIKYNDSITIEIQLGEEGYCYYTNNGESKLVRMPSGLYKWVTRNLSE